MILMRCPLIILKPFLAFKPLLVGTALVALLFRAIQSTPPLSILLWMATVIPIPGLLLIVMEQLVFFSRQFRYWRGSIVLKFKVVKTEFHSGRLLATFIPTDNRFTSAPVPFANQMYLLKQVIDIRDTNEFTITLPFIQNLNYLDNLSPSGTFTLSILDVLQAPDTVNSAISVILEIAGGEDLEFFMPLPNTMNPYIPVNPQSGWEPRGCEAGSTVIGGAVVMPSDNHAIACIGEKIVSVRQLCKFWNRMAIYSALSATRTTIIAPFINSCCLHNGSATPANSLNYPDWISVLSHGYTLSRGSVNVHVHNDQWGIPSTTRSQNLIIRYDPLVGAGYLTNFQIFYASTSKYAQPGIPYIYWDQQKCGPATINCPAWNKVPSRPIAAQYEMSQGQNLTHNYLPWYSIWVSNQDSGTSIWSCARSAGEDFTLGGFIGFGPFFIQSPGP